MCKKPVKAGKNTQVLCGPTIGEDVAQAEREREGQRGFVFNQGTRYSKVTWYQVEIPRYKY